MILALAQKGPHAPSSLLCHVVLGAPHSKPSSHTTVRSLTDLALREVGYNCISSYTLECSSRFPRSHSDSKASALLLGIHTVRMYTVVWLVHLYYGLCSQVIPWKGFYCISRITSSTAFVTARFRNRLISVDAMGHSTLQSKPSEHVQQLLMWHAWLPVKWFCFTCQFKHSCAS